MCRIPIAGVVFQILHYMLGFEKLGFETYYVEWDGNWIPNPVVESHDITYPYIMIGDVMRTYGFEDRWICRGDQVATGHTFGGIPYERLLKLYREAEAIFNVTGNHFIEAEMLHCPCRVYVESDPGIPQIKLKNGDPKMVSLVSGYTHHFTFGENINGADCLLPKTHLKYQTTRQPVMLDLWNNNSVSVTRNFTTISKWTTKKDRAIDYMGKRYRWYKDTEFKKFLDLPQISNQSLEMALSSINPEEKQRLKTYGWNVIDAIPLSSSLDRYLAYIQSSRGEFTIAKDQYVRLKTGWFSDRSASYLAAGRPVVTQDTGFGYNLPTGEGLFAFQTMDDILAAFETINSNYKKHCNAAREIAREYFDTNKVLTNLLESIGL
jgi:hypothetical protein